MDNSNMHKSIVNNDRFSMRNEREQGKQDFKLINSYKQAKQKKTLWRPPSPGGVLEK